MREQSKEIQVCIDELRRLVPALFEAQRILYVGANRHIVPTLVPELKEAGVSAQLLEIHEPNADYYRQEQPDMFEAVITGDVRKVDALAFPVLDAVVWWHGPEHLKANEWRPVLEKLEQRAPLVVVGCPWGEMPNPAQGGNEHEAHQTAVYPADLEGVGYEVQTVAVRGGADHKGLLIAWKGETGREDEAPMYYAKLRRESGQSVGPRHYTMWLVRNGTRQAMHNMAELYSHGLAPVIYVSQADLDELPIVEE